MEEETSHYLNTWHFYFEKGEHFKLHTTVGPVWIVQHKHISTVVKENLVRFIISSFVSLNNSPIGPVIYILQYFQTSLRLNSKLNKKRIRSFNDTLEWKFLHEPEHQGKPSFLKSEPYWP
jgi:hypothetical protein